MNTLRSKKAFTLIELLVVIAILGILASLLLPALNSARDSARTAVCLSNLKQYGYASILYSTDYDNAIPLIFDAFQANGSIRRGNFEVHDGLTRTNFYCYMDMMYPYMGSKAASGMFVCPNRPQAAPKFFLSDFYSLSTDFIETSYHYNPRISAKYPLRLSGDSPGSTTYRSRNMGNYQEAAVSGWPRLEVVTNPSETEQMGDASCSMSIYVYLRSSWKGWHGPKLNSTNRLFLDGHAASVNQSDRVWPGGYANAAYKEFFLRPN